MCHIYLAMMLMFFTKNCGQTHCNEKVHCKLYNTYHRLNPQLKPVCSSWTGSSSFYVLKRTPFFVRLLFLFWPASLPLHLSPRLAGCRVMIQGLLWIQQSDTEPARERGWGGGDGRGKQGEEWEPRRIMGVPVAVSMLSGARGALALTCPLAYLLRSFCVLLFSLGAALFVSHVPSTHPNASLPFFKLLYCPPLCPLH